MQVHAHTCMHEPQLLPHLCTRTPTQRCHAPFFLILTPPCFLPGAAFRERYLAHPSCQTTDTCLSAPGAENYGLLGTPGVGFSNRDTFVLSSGLDRTLLSAEAFLSGAFPAQSAKPPGGMSAVAGPALVDLVVPQVRSGFWVFL